MILLLWSTQENKGPKKKKKKIWHFIVFRESLLLLDLEMRH